MKRAEWTGLAGAALLALCLGTAQEARASVHGCRGLESGHHWASIEGRDGMFFRADPGLFNYHPMTDATIEELARLSRALDARGTTLVLAPIPTKALAMPRQLDHDIELFGYDPEIATTVHLEAMTRLRKAGLATADALQDLIRSEALPYFKADYRLNATGARIVAETIADAVRATDRYGSLARRGFTSSHSGEVEIASPMRMALQQHCEATLPAAVTDRFETKADSTEPGAGVIALVGTEFSDLPEVNFAGFLAQATELDVIQYSVPGGGAFAAISTYLTSQEFDADRPDILVWEFPVSDNPGGAGLQPLEELIAAALGACTTSLNLTMPDQDTPSRTASADLSGLGPLDGHSLLLDADGAAVGVARFAFARADGVQRTRILARHPQQLPTGRFFVPLSALWPDGAASVDITLDTPFGERPGLTLCKMGGT